MLPIPNLDDRTFEKMVQESRKLIPKVFPEWTDENVHDPGITFIELLSWMTEMQQYHLNQVTEDHERKFLKLLGYTLRSSQPARSQITIQNVEKETIVPKGTKLLAHQVPFETEKPIRLAASNLEKIIVSTTSETNDLTASNDNFHVSFLAFGTEARKGSSMYLGFDKPLPSNVDLSLFLQLSEQYPVPKGKFKTSEDYEQFIPSGKIEWHVYSYPSEEQESASWQQMKMVADETIHFSQSGRLIFQIEQEMFPSIMHPANDKGRYWISCTVVEEGFEVAPKIEQVSLNSIPVVQWETKSICLPFNSDGAANQQIQTEEYLALYGSIQLQVQNSNGEWVDWKCVDSFVGTGFEDQVFQLNQDRFLKKTTITFGNGTRGRIPPGGFQNIRVIAYQPSFEKQRTIGISNGLPNQTFDLRERILPDKFILQVGHRPKNQSEMYWRDWEIVENFDLSSSSAHHFKYSRETEKIIFGNNERGWIPPQAEEPNIRIISCRIGGGELGNVNRHTITEIVDASDDLLNVQITNWVPATGGQETESLLDAKGKIQHELLHTDRAVTAEDFDRIALHIPGLRMARVKTIPAYLPGLHNYPKQKAPGQVTVVVVPYSLSQKPKPSAGFLQTTKNHLNRYRLLTNHVHVIAPEYIRITVHAIVVVEPDVKDVSQKIKHKLQQYLKPLAGEEDSTGWEFGKTVFKGDIYGVLNQIDGVTYVQDLWLNAEGIGAVKEDGGNITIPPHGLVFSGDHEIEWVNRHDL